MNSSKINKINRLVLEIFAKKKLSKNVRAYKNTICTCAAAQCARVFRGNVVSDDLRELKIVFKGKEWLPVLVELASVHLSDILLPVRNTTAGQTHLSV